MPRHANSHVTYRVVRGGLVALLLSHAAGAQAASTDTLSSAGRRLGPVTSNGEPRAQVGLSISAAQTVGVFRDQVSDGIGVGAHALYRLGATGAFALRLDGGFVNYGRETVHLPLSSLPGGGRIGLDVSTTNNIFWLGVGPQLVRPNGSVRPYVNATVGLSLFATLSSVKGGSAESAFANDTNMDYGVFSWGSGTGVLVPVRRGARTLAFLDFGARYHNNGRSVRYLREGGVHDLPDGSVRLDTISSRADLVTWHLGLSIGVR
jgi:hypothetical protein